MSGPQVELKKAENAWKPGTKNANADGEHRILFCNYRLFLVCCRENSRIQKLKEKLKLKPLSDIKKISLKNWSKS